MADQNMKDDRESQEKENAKNKGEDKTKDGANSFGTLRPEESAKTEEKTVAANWKLFAMRAHEQKTTNLVVPSPSAPATPPPRTIFRETFKRTPTENSGRLGAKRQVIETIVETHQ